MNRIELSRMNVLLVDDSRNMLRLLEEILRALGIRNIVSVTDAADAFREMRINAIDLAIVDFDMQPLDGLEFLRMARTAKDSTNKFVPVIMLTAHTQLANVTEARDAGAHEFLAKPVSPESVIRRILNVIKEPRPFVKTKTYFGPDRRRRDVAFNGPDRRKSKGQAGDGAGASQQDVDALFDN